VNTRLIAMASLLVGVVALLAIVRGRIFPEPTYLNRAVSSWVGDLNSTNSAVRQQAIGALKQIGPESVPPLVRALRVKRSRLTKIFLPNWDQSSWFAYSRLNQARTQLRAAKALKELGPIAAPAVLELFLDAESGVQQSAVETLAGMGPSVVPLMAKSLGHREVQVRTCSAFTLGRLGTSSGSAVPALMEALSDPVPSVRSAAATALGDIGPSARPAVPQLIRALQDPEFTVGSSALRALDRLGPAAAAAAPALLSLAKREGQFLRGDLIHALGKIGPEARAAVPFLQERLQDADILVRLETARSFWRITQRADPTVPVLIGLLDGNGLVFRCRTIELLGEIGPPATNAVPALLAILNSSPPHDDRYAATALGRIAPDLMPSIKPWAAVWRRP
jgi:HEAT repeat protein